MTEPGLTPLDDDAQNVTLKQVAGDFWEVVVSGSETVVGRIEKRDGDYAATDADGLEVGTYGSPEQALFGIVNRP